MDRAQVVGITGGSGFVGSKLASACLRRGHSVRVLSRRSKKLCESLDWFQGDLTNLDFDPVPFLDGVDVLFNCAAELKDESKMADLNVKATERLLSIAETRVKRWVQLSSVGVYGEIGDNEVDESTSESPYGTYEKTKAQADQIVRSSTIPNVVLRPSNVFGPEMPNQSLKQLVLAIEKGWFVYFGNKKAKMKYVHLTDVVNALLLCGWHENAAGKTFIVSDTLMLERFVHTVCRAKGIIEPSLSLPILPVKILTKFFQPIRGFPLSTSRLSALTNHGYYKSHKIKKELGFIFDHEIEYWIAQYAKQLKT